MDHFLTIRVSSKHVDAIVTDFLNFGWQLQSKTVVQYRDDMKVIGYFDEDNDNQLIELSFQFDDSCPNGEEIFTLSNEYLKAKDKRYKSKSVSIKKFVTGMVFGTIITVAAIIMLVNNLIVPGIIVLAIGLPAIPLGIFGIINRTRHSSNDAKTSFDKVEEIKEKIASLKKNEPAE